jgi:hypothetical protein
MDGGLRLGFVAAQLMLVLGGATSGGDTGSSAGPPPPLALPPKGTVLFTDQFLTLDAWHPDRDGVWTAEDSVLCGRLPDEKQKRSFLYAGSEEWRDYALDLDLCQRRGVDKGVVVRARAGQGIGLDLRGGDYQDVLLYRQNLPLGRAKAPNADHAWHHLRVESRGSRYWIFVDGKRVLDCRDPLGASPRGRIALVAYTGGQGECSVQYANVVVTKLE